MKQAGLLLVVLLLVASFPCAACAGGVDALPKCPSEPVKAPADWSRQEIEEGFTFALPPSCVPDKKAPRRVHGGLDWVCDGFHVSVVWGMWGPGSFGEGRHECRTTLGSLPAMVSRPTGDRGHIVWYRTGKVHEPIIVTGADAADVSNDMLWQVAASGVFTGTPGPGK